MLAFSKRLATLYFDWPAGCLSGFFPRRESSLICSPNIDFIIETFESKSLEPVDLSSLLLEAHHKLNVPHLNNELTILENEPEAKKKIGENLYQLREFSQIHHWWGAPIDDLNLEQLKNLNAALVELQKIVKIELKKPMYENAYQNPNLDGINPQGIGLFGIDAKENVHGF